MTVAAHVDMFEVCEKTGWTFSEYLRQEAGLIAFYKLFRELRASAFDRVRETDRDNG